MNNGLHVSLAAQFATLGSPLKPKPQPSTPNPKPQTLNPKPYTPNPKPQILHPKPGTGLELRGFWAHEEIRVGLPKYRNELPELSESRTPKLPKP